MDAVKELIIRSAEERLKTAGIPFARKNNGVHLVIVEDTIVDFWPTTGKWKERSGAEGIGVGSLLAHLGYQK